jgi:hypothetical protein
MKDAATGMRVNRAALRAGAWCLVVGQLLAAGVLAIAAFIWNASFVNDAMVDLATFPWWSVAGARFLPTLLAGLLLGLGTYASNRWLVSPQLNWTRSQILRFSSVVTSIFLAGGIAGALFLAR